MLSARRLRHHPERVDPFLRGRKLSAVGDRVLHKRIQGGCRAIRFIRVVAQLEARPQRSADDVRQGRLRDVRGVLRLNEAKTGLGEANIHLQNVVLRAHACIPTALYVAAVRLDQVHGFPNRLGSFAGAVCPPVGLFDRERYVALRRVDIPPRRQRIRHRGALGAAHAVSGEQRRGYGRRHAVLIQHDRRDRDVLRASRRRDRYCRSRYVAQSSVARAQRYRR